MSDPTRPPGPSGPPPSGPPPAAPPGAQPPAGPPSFPPPPQGPEYLGGGAYPPHPPAPSAAGGRGRRRALIGGGAVLGVAALGVGGWFAWSAYFATGPQPAEALPASTIGYVSVDLDPSGKQKLAALDTLEKFPAFSETTGLDSGDDLRKRLVEAVQEDEGICPEIDFDDDIAPWLGDRLGFAAVDRGDEGVAPVLVLQVTDAEKADEGLSRMEECATGSEDSDELGDTVESEPLGGFVVEGDWAVLAESQDVAQEIVDEAGDEPLSDDDDFEKWTDEAGDPGIITLYAAPEAGPHLASAIGDLSGFGSAFSCEMAVGVGPDPYETEDPFAEDEPYDPYEDPSSDYDECVEQMEEDAEEVRAQLDEQLADFGGAAVKVRFDDGALEIETAQAPTEGTAALVEGDGGDDVVSTLPANTGIALGIGFAEGWGDELLALMESSGGGLDVESLVAEAETATGLDLPDDVETLLGDSAALAVSGDFDPEDLSESAMPEDFPLGLKVAGDPDDVRGVIERLLGADETPDELGDLLETDSEGEHVAVAPSEAFRAELLEDGDLGGEDAYQDVVRESGDASMVLFMNFDAGDWLVDAFGEGMGPDEEVTANLEPLRALGLSTWADDDVVHGVLRITTE